MKMHGVLDAFAAEAQALGRGLIGIADPQWERPTRCEPWSVRELLGHVCVGLGWLPGMLAAPAPESAETSAAEYYRPDDRFNEATNAKRIDLGRNRLAHLASGALASEFAAAWQEVERQCRREPEGRVVRTRHGDAMLLTDFLRTRVVEIAVHGLDLSDALGRGSWLSGPAARVVLELLVGAEADRAVTELGWSEELLLRKATGRSDVTAAESARLAGLGIRWLTLG